MADRETRLKAVLVLLLASLFYFFSSPEVDPDLWGHLFFGIEILQGASILRTNLYSYTAPGQDWVNHEWLAEVFFYGVYHFLGSPGLILFKLAFGCGVIWLLDRSLRQAGFSFWARGISLVWVMAMLSPGFNVRPQIFTYLLFAAVLGLCYRYEASGRKTIYWVPALMAVWVNLHGGFVAGVGALGVFFLARLGTERSGGEPVGLVVARLGLPLLLTLVALLVNPYGFRLLGFVGRDLLLERPITEWEPIALMNFSFLEFKLALLVLVPVALWNSSWKRWDFILAALAALFALRHRRHIPLFAIAAAPFLVAGVDWGCRYLKGKVGQWVMTSVILGVAAYQMAAIGRVHFQHRFQLVVNPQEYPTQAADFLKRNDVRGNLAVPFDWGEYLIWKLYPNVRVSMDGRFTTSYPLEVIEDNFEWMRGGKNWRKLLDSYPTEIAVTNRYHPVTALMRKDSEWVYIYSDPITFIFVRELPSQKELLAKFREKKLLPPLTPSFYFPG